MRSPLRSLAAASIFVVACSSSSTSDSTAAESSGTETSATTGASSDPASTGASSSVPARAPRATLDPERLASCTPEAALAAGGPDVAVTIAPTLGGCRVRAPAPQPTGEPNALELNVLGGPTRVAEVVDCAPGQTPAVDFETHSYATFTSTHRVSEDWRVVFAVDDGERVHVGIRLGRNCQAATATTAPDAQAFEIAGRARSIVVHRCEPRSDPPSAPPTCP